MSDNSLMWEALEECVRARQVDKAKRILRGAERRYRSDPGAFSRVCDAYRRLGLYSDGLRALNLKKGARMEGSRALWAARFLNAAGAATFARSLMSRVVPQSAEDHRVVAGLLLSFYEPEPALRSFEKMRDLDPDPSSYVSRVALVAMSDALADLERFEEALALLEEVRSRTGEELLLGIVQQARGEYLARLGRFKAALKDLSAAVGRFPSDDRSFDFAMTCKWLGYVQLRLGHAHEGRGWMDRALSLVLTPKMRPEVWLDVLLLRAQADPEWQDGRASSLLAYPLCPTGFVEKLRRPETSRVGPETAALHLDLAADERWLDGSPTLGISTELHLLALMRLASPLGLNRETAKALLWPEEAYAYLQLDDRLDKLISRLVQAHKFQAVRKEGWLWLNSREARRIAVTAGTRSALPSLLRARDELTPSEIDRYYGVSRGQRQAIIERWQAMAWIRPEGAGRATRYRIVRPPRNNRPPS